MMTEINALWRRVRALQRKLARELAELRLGRICDDLCERWYAAWSDHKPLPGIQPFIKRVMDAGYRRLPLGAANNYLLNVVLAKMRPPTLRCCSTPSSPRLDNIQPVLLKFVREMHPMKFGFYLPNQGPTAPSRPFGGDHPPGRPVGLTIAWWSATTSWSPSQSTLHTRIPWEGSSQAPDRASSWSN